MNQYTIDKESKIGIISKSFITNQIMTIIKYNSYNNITIRFEDGTVIDNVQYNNFIRGNIDNPCYPTIYNRGYRGIGEYKCRKNNKDSIEYIKWRSMFERCYSLKYHKVEESYKNCEVSKKWYNFQNFAKWYNENLWNKDIKLCLDKDILSKNNKIYVPKHCVLVPQDINNLFTKSNKTRGKLPIGINVNPRNPNLYVSQISIKNSKKFLGHFSNVQDAFDAYKHAKESYIKQVANEYKSKYPNFPERLYQALINYEVEITD